jgi:inosine/xanthosine triphosphate pyrophosphatase family protein
MKVLIATNNQRKVLRFKEILKWANLDIQLHTPDELGVEVFDVEENGKNLEENALLKAKAYFGKTDMPILSNDTGLYVVGEGLVDAPKRKALGGSDEKKLTKEEISRKILDFWKGMAKKYGGKVDATWVEAFVIIYPNGEIKKSESRREIVLTDQEFGVPFVEMPIRALYYSKVTGKPAIQHNEADDKLEMKPIEDALRKVLIK